MDADALIAVVSSAATALVIIWAIRSSERQRSASGRYTHGSLILRPTKVDLFVGLASGALFVPSFFLSLMAGVTFFGLLVLASLSLGSIYMVARWARHRVIIDDETLQLLDIWGRPRSIRWSEVEEIEAPSTEFIVRARTTRIVVRFDLVGIADFCEVVQRRFPNAILSVHARAQMERIAQRAPVI